MSSDKYPRLQFNTAILTQSKDRAFITYKQNNRQTVIRPPPSLPQRTKEPISCHLWSHVWSLFSLYPFPSHVCSVSSVVAPDLSFVIRPVRLPTTVLHPHSSSLTSCDTSDPSKCICPSMLNTSAVACILLLTPSVAA